MIKIFSIFIANIFWLLSCNNVRYFCVSRSDIQYTTNSSKTFLKIPDVKLEDEGLYKCEATYLAVNRECNNVQHIILNVTGEFHDDLLYWNYCSWINFFFNYISDYTLYTSIQLSIMLIFIYILVLYISIIYRKSIKFFHREKINPLNYRYQERYSTLRIIYEILFQVYKNLQKEKLRFKW